MKKRAESFFGVPNLLSALAFHKKERRCTGKNKVLSDWQPGLYRKFEIVTKKH